MQLFRALEKILNCLLAQENMKKPSSKVAHNSYLEVFYAAFLEQPIQPNICQKHQIGNFISNIEEFENPKLVC